MSNCPNRAKCLKLIFVKTVWQAMFMSAYLLAQVEFWDGAGHFWKLIWCPLTLMFMVEVDSCWKLVKNAPTFDCFHWFYKAEFSLSVGMHFAFSLILLIPYLEIHDDLNFDYVESFVACSKIYHLSIGSTKMVACIASYDPSKWGT